jgi:hypothetical protein
MPNTTDYVVALNNLLNMPEHDGTPETNRRRLKVKNAAKRLIKAYTDNRALAKDVLAKQTKVNL